MNFIISDLNGKSCETLITTRTGRVIAWPGEIIKPHQAKDIISHKSAVEDLVYGIRPGDIFQKSHAFGTGLVDIDGNVY